MRKCEGWANAVPARDDIRRVCGEVSMLYSAGDVSRAMRQLLGLARRMTAGSPKADEVFRLLGMMYYTSGDLRNARRWLKKAVGINPTSEAASGALFLCLRRLNDAHGAIKEVRRFLALLPNSDYGGQGEAFVLLGGHLLEQGNYTSALRWLVKATRLSPRSEMASLLLCMCYWNTGNRAKAMQESRRFLALVPDSESTSEARTLVREFSKLGRDLKRGTLD